MPLSLTILSYAFPLPLDIANIHSRTTSCLYNIRKQESFGADNYGIIEID